MWDAPIVEIKRSSGR